MKTVGPPWPIWAWKVSQSPELKGPSTGTRRPAALSACTVKL